MGELSPKSYFNLPEGRFVRLKNGESLSKVYANWEEANSSPLKQTQTRQPCDCVYDFNRGFQVNSKGVKLLHIRFSDMVQTDHLQDQASVKSTGFRGRRIRKLSQLIQQKINKNKTTSLTEQDNIISRKSLSNFKHLDSEQGKSNRGTGDSTTTMGEVDDSVSIQTNDRPPKIFRRHSISTTPNSSMLDIDNLHSNRLPQSVRLDQSYKKDALCINIDGALVWYNYGFYNDLQETKSKKFKSLITSHDCIVRNGSCCDILLGFQNGQVAVLNTQTGNQVFYNREGSIDKAPVTCVKWIPSTALEAANNNTTTDTCSSQRNGNSEMNNDSGYISSMCNNTYHPTSSGRDTISNLFMVAHSNGAIYFYDNTKSEQFSAAENKKLGKLPFGFAVMHFKNKCNPFIRWRIGKGSVNAFEFSPDGRYVAIVGKDGCLRIVKYRTQGLIVTFQSYFGALRCVAWSPDSKYIIAGGEDDLISLWSLEHKSIVVRGEGHSSWLSACRFDPYQCNQHVYRFVSVGMDRRLIIWEIKKHEIEHVLNVMSRTNLSHPGPPLFNNNSPNTTTTTTTAMRRRNNTAPLLTNRNPNPNPSLTPQTDINNKAVALLLPTMSRLVVPFIKPLCNIVAHPSPVSDIAISKESIITSCMLGIVHYWVRPPSELCYKKTEKSHLVDSESIG